ncbi:16S rRNA (cytosine(1402)-N(4))-methyltransferase RsmH [soil metagenome]
MGTAGFWHLADWPMPSSVRGARLPGGRPGLNGVFASSQRDGGGGGDVGARAGEPDGGGAGFAHRPVLLDEVIHFLAPAPGKLILDGTLGGGGHSERLLEAGACVLGLDQDPAALAAARGRLAKHAQHLAALRLNFRDFSLVLEEAGIGGIDGALVDLGVSSHQLDEPERGFSIRADGPLDMRMDPDSPLKAEDLVNEMSEGELADVFYHFGGERASRRVARIIVGARARGRITTTGELAALVERAKGGRSKGRAGKIHPATQVFQALRIAVNDELGALEEFLENAVRWLRPGGRIAVITFHSLEDRIVKQFIRSRSQEWLDRPEWPEPRPNPERALRPVVRKALTASPGEIAANPRARSAKLRVAERLATS